MGLSLTAAAENEVDYRPQAPTQSSTGQMGVSHTRSCLLMLMRCSVVTFCSLACSLMSTWYVRTCVS